MDRINKKQISLFHVAKTKTGMSDDEKAALLNGFGVTSCKDLKINQFNQVMKHFELMGFKSNARFKKKGSKGLLLDKVKAIKLDMGLTENYINGTCRKMFKNSDGEPIEQYRWLTAKQLHKLVAALSYHQKRKNISRRGAKAQGNN